MNLTPKQQEIVAECRNRARANGWLLVAFWQDRFYTRKYFGYPVCIQLQNPDEGNKVEDSHILGWSHLPTICDKWVTAIDAYVALLDAAEVAK